MSGATGRVAGLAAGRAFRAEWTKLRTARSTALLAPAAAVMTAVLGAVVCAAAAPGTTTCAAGCDPVKLCLSGVYLGQLAVVVLGTVMITGEYHTGLIGSTIIATPQRLTVFVAKAAVVAVAVIPPATVAVAGSMLAGRQLLSRSGLLSKNGFPPLFVAEPTLRAAGGTVLYLALVALFTLGVATAVRNTAVALTTIFGLLYLLPLLAQFVTDEAWHARIERYAPMNAGLSVQATQDFASLAIEPWAGLGVLATYTSCALALGATLLSIRDV